MTRLEMAVARFSGALESLEIAIGDALRAAEDVSGAGVPPGDERDALAARIAELEEEARLLAGVTSDVEVRLDGAIAEIRQVLGRSEL